ncbi:NAD-dependent epimerase/dehydratase family protein [Polymorphobacter arshaanensis]|uniref:GDP-mannose 4,6-dehydratase n=1 Tax=Glacieibacterium arshaanense TaxID=2511025 RepID=A0A4Y9ENC4_9SPHN|nr:GDP-mannose 4,6-dehydratase [Polymorphobacter arshaanensis]TFU03271.1 NAD-dependent epimerase/dehydratase family protein [Polymorphobacter arshaanensis]
MTLALIVGGSGQDGAYLARLLLARGANVFATTRNTHAQAGARLAIVGVADAVKLHRFDAATATPDAMAKLLDTLQPDQIYHLAASPDVTTWLQAIRDRAPALRLFAAASAATPEAVAAVRQFRESHGVFAVTGLLGAHESRLAPPSALLRHIVEAAHACKHGGGEKLRIGALDTLCDIGWAPEYVDAMTKMLSASAAADCAISTGRPIALQDFVAQAFDTFGLDWQAHVDIDPAFSVPAVAAVIGDPVPAQTLLRWRADTFGKDLVETLCEAAGAGAHLA